MRIVFVFPLLLLLLLGGVARPQTPLDTGSPDAAFAGGPIHLTKAQTALLRAHYQGDKVPLVPQPFRGKLDTALTGRDWRQVDTLKQQLAAAHGIVAEFAWEQSRFIATGSPAVAEIHALDLASTGATAVSETAVMLWFYAVAVTMTDGQKCNDPAAKDAHLDRLRGPAFEPVTRIVRTISDDRLAAMRDLAIRLEAVLAPVRDDDIMCRVGDGAADVKPDQSWRAEAAMTRTMLPRHLIALASVMRPRPIARAEPPKPEPEPARPVAAKPEPEQFRFEPMLPGSILDLPPLPEPVDSAPAPLETEISPAGPAKAEPPPPAPSRSAPSGLKPAVPGPSSKQ